MTRVRLASSTLHAARHRRPRFIHYVIAILGTVLFSAPVFFADDLLHFLISISMAVSFALLCLISITRGEGYARRQVHLSVDGPLTFTPTIGIRILWAICAAGVTVTSVCVALSWITPGVDPFGSHSRRGILIVPMFLIVAALFVTWTLARIFRTVGLRFMGLQ